MPCLLFLLGIKKKLEPSYSCRASSSNAKSKSNGYNFFNFFNFYNFFNFLKNLSLPVPPEDAEQVEE